MGRYRMFSGEQVEELKAMSLTMSPKELSIHFNCSLPTIYKYLQEFKRVLNANGETVGVVHNETT
jgi:hypothetical protein